MKQKRTSKEIGKWVAGVSAVVVAVTVIFFFAKNQAKSATVTRPGAASDNVQTFAFPATSGSSSFDVVSLPATDYSGSGYSGSSIFTAYDGTSQASNYMNFAHMGQNSETSDKFLLQFFNQDRCITDSTGKSVAGTMKEVRFVATFIKPNLTPPTSSPRPTTRITIRAYDHFDVTWGNGQLTVTMKRYWRAITLPTGTTPETFSLNSYYIQEPLPTDVASSEPVIKTLSYTGEFAPFSTRINHGQPYDTDNFARPVDVKVNKEKNISFAFFDITTTANGDNATADKVECRLDNDTIAAETPQACGCLNNNDILACGDPNVDFIDVWPPVQFSIFSGTQWQIEDIAGLRDSVSSYGEQFANDGQVSLQLNAYDATENAKYHATVLPLNFLTTPENAYFSWCFNGKSQQGLVAGGEKIEETRSTTATAAADSSGCCNLVTRTPKVDNTGADSEGRPSGGPDGVDDDWQLKYGFKLTGKQGYMLPANYDADSSGNEAVRGIPGDGFVADQFLDLNQQPIALTPASINSRTGEKYKTGDGKFIAAEEYIWGTDPTEYDSDLDGYSDEADIVGIGQKSMDFIAEVSPYDTNNDRVDVRVKSVGKIEQMRSQTKNPADEQQTTGLDLQNVVRVAQDQRNIFARTGGTLGISLSAEPASPGLLDTLTVSSSLVRGESAGNAVFHWFAKRKPGHGNNPGTGQPSGKKAFLEGESINKLEKKITEICPECQPGDELVISVQVNDTLTGQVASADITVEVGDNNSLQIFQDCNTDGSDEEVGSSNYCFHSNQVTKDIPVRVSANFFNITAGQFFFQWKLNGVLQTSNCLPTGATSATAPQKCGLGTNQLVFQPHQDRTEYAIELKVYKNDREDVAPSVFNPTPSVEIAHFTSTISSGNPAVTVVLEPAPSAPQGGYAAGTQVTARAVVEFLDPKPKGQLVADPNVPGTVDGAHKLRYIWFDSNHNILKVEELNSIDQSTVIINGSKPGTAQVSVMVVSPDYVSNNNPNTPIPVGGSVVTYFVAGNSTSLASLLSERFASLIGFVPKPVQGLIKIAAVITFAGILVLGFASVPQFKKRSS